jgi:REP element-mobilizing transposase RayT
MTTEVTQARAGGAGLRDARRRSGHVSVAGRAYVLTLATLFRRPVFRDPLAARAVARLHLREGPWGQSNWLAWVLMPDHWQGLVVLGGGDSLEALVGRFKGISARSVDPRHCINGWLWGRGFQDRSLADDEPLADAARHLVTAPRRAGIVASLADYPYWDCAWPCVDLLEAPTD